MMHIGGLIQKLRKDRGLTQKEMADSLSKFLNQDIHVNYISRWETAAFPPLESIADVCSFFKIQLWELFILENPDESTKLKKMSKEDSEFLTVFSKLKPESKMFLSSFVKSL